MDIQKEAKVNYFEGKMAATSIIKNAKRAIFISSILFLICLIALCVLIGFAIAKNNMNSGVWFSILAAFISMISVILSIMSLNKTLHRSLVELGRIEVKLGEY